MTTSDGWPEGLPAGGFRIARRSNRLAEAAAFYLDLVGLPLLMAGARKKPRGKVLVFWP